MSAMTRPSTTPKTCPVCGGPVRLLTRYDGYGHLNKDDARRHLDIALNGKPQTGGAQ